MRIIFTFLISTLILGFISCEKQEGPGGTSTIVGKIWVKDYTTDFAVLKAEFWAEEVDVYLIYGNDSIYSDRTKTNYDGSYWFEYLHEGSYTVYAYSRDSASIDRSASGNIPIKMQVDLSKGSDVIVPLITILD